MTTPNTSNNAAGAEQPALSRFSMSYAYDVSKYADFSIEAATEEDAVAIAEKLLKQEVLPELLDCHASEYDNGTTNLRVFSGGECSNFTAQTLDEIAELDGFELPEEWNEVPAPEPVTPRPDELEPILNDVRALPGLDEEADTFRSIAEILWGCLSPGQREEAIANPRLAKIAQHAAEAAADEE